MKAVIVRPQSVSEQLMRASNALDDAKAILARLLLNSRVEMPSTVLESIEDARAALLETMTGERQWIGARDGVR